MPCIAGGTPVTIDVLLVFVVLGIEQSATPTKPHSLKDFSGVSVGNHSICHRERAKNGRGNGTENRHSNDPKKRKGPTTPARQNNRQLAGCVTLTSSNRGETLCSRGNALIAGRQGRANVSGEIRMAFIGL
jgi:hypothetical protein